MSLVKNILLKLFLFFILINLSGCVEEKVVYTLECAKLNPNLLYPLAPRITRKPKPIKTMIEKRFKQAICTEV